MRRFDALRRTALTAACSVTMVCSSLAPMAVHAEAPSAYPSIQVGGNTVFSADNWDDEQQVYRTDTYGGTMTYDPEKDTLTLRGVHLDVTDANSLTVGSDVSTIELQGSNSITNRQSHQDETNDEGNVTKHQDQYAALSSTGAITITGDGRLDIAANSLYGIYATGSVNVKDTTLTVLGREGDVSDSKEDDYPNYGIYTTNCGADITISGSDATITGYNYGVYTVLDGDLSIVSSSATISSANVVYNKDERIDENAANTYAVHLGSHYGGPHYYTDTNGDRVNVWAYGYAGISKDSEVTIIGGLDVPNDRLSITSSTYDQELKDEGVEKVYVDVETGTKRDKSDAAAVNGSPFEEDELNKTASTSLSNLKNTFYIHTKDSRFKPYKANNADEGAEDWSCHHVYEWEVYEQATATNDGIMRYRCKYCGKVDYEVPVSAYYVFNKDTQQAILNAEQGATVTTETALFISFHEMVKDALAERPDVTLVVDYRNAGKNYEMTIPAGSGDQLETLFGDSQFAGFLYLGGTYATTELPEDWEFSTVPASIVWFGTTNAH